MTPSPTTIPGNDLEKAKVYLGEAGGALPGEPAYFFKQFGEQARYFITLDPADKAGLKMQYAERRLAEARQLAEDPKKASSYEATLQAYRQAMDDASSQLKQAGESEDARDMAKDLENQAARHEAVLEKGLLPTPLKNPEIIREAIAATENAMDRSADILDRPALPPVLTYRLEDLKAQGLVLPEEVEDLTRSGSREEVREKVRKLVEIGSFPPADAKKLDEAQVTASPADYVQLVEVRKVEELQGLRSVQTDFAQTPTLKAKADVLSQREKSLTETIDISFIRPEDLTGRDDLKAVYDKLAASSSARPINRGQFGAQLPAPTNVVLTTCPAGATFKTNEGCVWADSGNKINDYDQYKCSGAGQYYSFAAKKCVPNQRGGGFGDDASPVCPAGYNWVWQTQSCQTSDNEITPLPTPGQGDSNSCPQGSSYQAPNGCVWDNNGKKVADSTDYSCKSNQYYSFSQFKCVPQPKPGEVSSKDFVPSCKDPNAYWSWSDGKCALPRPIEGGIKEINIPQPTFVPPGNPFYFVKQFGETVQRTIAFTPQRREQVSLSQAKERLAEAADALKKDDKAGVKVAITAYISTMQNLVADVPREGLSEGAKQEIAKGLSDGSVEQSLMLQKLSAWAKEGEDDLIQAATSTPILGVDRASDILGDPPIPEDIRAKIEALPGEMISEENKKKLLEADSRVAVRIELTNLSNVGGLGRDDVVFLNDDFNKVDTGAQVELEELSKLADVADITDQKEQITEKVEKNEGIVKKLDEFQNTFEVGNEIPADIRPYVRLTRIDEVAQTVRPDIVRIEEFQNRKDLVLAVATLQQEYKPTRQDVGRVEEFRRRNPNAALPFEFARIEALAYSLGVRETAGPCFLPSPPFPANTPCPAPGAAIPITSYSKFVSLYSPVDETGYFYGNRNITPSTDKDGNPLVYGQGPKPASPGVCQSGYHWMYDSGGWCMSDGGSYGNYGGGGTYTPSGYGSGYTPYSPYYTAPGASPATSGYPVGDVSPNDGCPYGSDSDGRGKCIPNSYPASSYSYNAPSYYGSAPTYYTTNPPAGTVPGSGPRPTASGQCPSGFHWMSDSGGWCMADGGTYVPGSSNTGGYNYYSPNLTQSSCGPGYYWDGQGCIRTSPTDTYGSCRPPSSGCGSNSYWDYGSCSCRPSSSPTSYSGSSSGSSAGCSNYPSGGCGSNNWFDWGSCSCRASSSSSGTSTYTSGSSGGSSQLGIATGAFEDASITTGASSSEFGNAQGGIINITTKTGGSRYTGSLNYETTNFPGRYGSNFNMFQGSFGGPIMKNFTFFASAKIEGSQSSNGGYGGWNEPSYVRVAVDTTYRLGRSFGNIRSDSIDVSVYDYAVVKGDCDNFSFVTNAANPDIRDNYGYKCSSNRTATNPGGTYYLAGKLNYTFGAGSRVALSYNTSGTQARNPLSDGRVAGSQSFSNVATLNWTQTLTRSSTRNISIDAYLSYQWNNNLNSRLTASSEAGTREPFMGFLLKPLKFEFTQQDFPLDSTLIYNILFNRASRRIGLTDKTNTNQYNSLGNYNGGAPDLLGNLSAGGGGGNDIGLSYDHENRWIGKANLDAQVDQYNRVKAGVELTSYDIASMQGSTNGLTPLMVKPVRRHFFVEDRLDLGDVVLVGGLSYDYFWTKAWRWRDYPRIATRPGFNPDSLYCKVGSTSVDNAGSICALVQDPSHNY
ncbi:MAG: hypothetical protein UV41_C0040G0001, partial [Candidatus Daviesbacteria bacterium GW2011_GWA2_42_7]